MPIECFTNIKGNKDLEEHFSGIDDSMSESQQRAEGVRLANEYHNKVLTDLNNLRTEMGLNTKPVPAPINNAEQINRVKEKYQSKITEAQKRLTPKVVKDTEILSTFDKVTKAVPDADLTSANDVLQRVNKAENINEGEIKKAEDDLYSALDAAPEAAHLIEPLILKLQDYEFKTKTEISTVTESQATGTSTKVRKEIRPALEQSEGSEVTVTLPDGGVRKGKLSIKSGQYVVDIPQGRQVIIGEKAITDSSLKLPSEERVPEPITFDEHGRVNGVTFETKNGNLVTIHDPEKALDLAIQLKVEAQGEIPDAYFEEVYKEVERTITKEVPLGGKNEKDGQSGGNNEVKINSEKVQYNGTDAIGSRSRSQSEQDTARAAAKEKIKNPDTNASLKAANDYNESVGLPPVEKHEFKPSDPKLQGEIAKEYPELQDVNSPTYKETDLERGIYESYKNKFPELIQQHDIKDYKDLVNKAYAELAKEVDAQFKALPIKVDFHEGDKNYENSAEMLDDVHNFNHLWVFKGGDDHPSLGSKTMDANGLTVNDKFRAVHDYFGHSIDGYQFGKDGEENAWIEHSKMFSPLSRLALSSETRGQNSFVNYSGVNDVPLQKIKLGSALKSKGLKENNQQLISEGQKLIDEGSGELYYAEQKAVVLSPEYTDISKYYKPKQESKFEQPKGDNSTGTPPPESGTDNIVPDADFIGITHAQTDEIARDLGFEEYEKNPETNAQWNAEADARIKKNPKAVQTLLNKMQKGHIPDKVEQKMIGKYVAALDGEIQKTGSNSAIAEMRRVIDLSNVAGGREAAKSLAARKGIYKINDSFSGYMMTEMDANLEAPLTDKQKATVKKEYDNITEKEKKHNDAVSKLEAENAKLKAQVELNKTAEETKKSKGKSTTKEKKTPDDFAKQRQDILQKAKEKIQAARDKANDPNAPETQGIGGRTWADDLFTIAPEVLKLVKSYVEEGVSKLSDVVERAHKELKGAFPEISESDIHDIIAGRYNPKQKTKNELQAKVFDLRTEANLISKLQRLQDGTEPKEEKAKIKRSQEIVALQKQIKDFKKENPDQAAYLKSLETKNKNALDKVNEELKSGNFTVAEKKIPLFYNSDLKNRFPALFDNAIKSQHELIKAKQERQLRLAVQTYNNRSSYDKILDKLIRIANVPRTLMASMDFSAPLRQAVVVTVAHPTMAFKAGIEMFKQSWSQERFDTWVYNLKETSRYQLMMDSKLSLTDPHSLHLKAQEEAFMGNIAEEIPVIGGLVKGSERAYVSYLNKMRVDMFNRYADVYEQQGKTYENSPELFKGLASYVNNATGRGELGVIETSAPVLNTLLFSPRLIASRFNMLGLGDIPNLVMRTATLGKKGVNTGFYTSLPKEVRVLAMKDMATFIAAGLGVLAFAKYGFGADIEADPRSSDFGKIQVGNTRYDLWGGFQPFVRVIAQTISQERKGAESNKITPLTGKGSKFGSTGIDPLLSFGRGKLAPIPSVIVDLISRRTIIGDKVLLQWGGKIKDREITLKDEAIQHLLPLIYSDVSKAMQDKGISSLFTVGIPATFGVGVATYDNKKK